MTSNYNYKTRDISFILEEWLKTDEILQYPRYKEFYSKADFAVIIENINKIAKEVVAPTNDDGEKASPYFNNGRVYYPESFKKIFKYIQENGWGTGNYNKKAEGTLPYILMTVVGELFGAANPAFMPYIGLTSGAAQLIQTFGNESVKDLFLAKLMDGSWSGTMCLTEPTAGSDVGDILSIAGPTDDPRIYKIKGNKLFISGGDGDHVENIIHLYLARIEGARPGVKGISLFIVPKYWVNDDGSLEPNDVTATGIEHKMGMRGSATTALSFGENNHCRGWILGGYNSQTGEGEGMKQMFQMMNEERLNTGIIALGLTANAYWNTVDYCNERIQGRPLKDSKSGRTQIINHEDIKRTLLLVKSTTEACRAMIYKTFYYIDIHYNETDPEKKKFAHGMIECLTPLCKAYTSDEAWSLLSECIQAYGGYGYCEDFPVSQAARDCKILTIWEGTNFIQSMDLIGRKWTLNQGKTFGIFLNEIKTFLEKKHNNFTKEFDYLFRAYIAYRDIQKSMMNYFQNNQISMMPVYSKRILTATAQLFSAYYLLEQALIASERLDNIKRDDPDYSYYNGKILSAKFYIANILPNVWLVTDLLKEGDTSVIDAEIDIFKQ